MTKSIIRFIRLLFVLSCIAMFSSSCASTNLSLRTDLTTTDGTQATITFKRLNTMIGAAVPLCVMDSGTGIPYDTDKNIGIMTARARERRLLWQKDYVFDLDRLWMPFDALLIGTVGPGDSLTWRRPPGIMQIEVQYGVNHLSLPCYKVEAGKTYVLEYNYAKGAVSAVYSLGDPSHPQTPIASCAAPTRQPAVQTIDRLPRDNPRGYVEFYVSDDSALDMFPIGQIMTTNWIAHSTVYREKKLRIACPPGILSFVTYNLGKLGMSDEMALEKQPKTYGLNALKFMSLPNPIHPAKVEVREGMVTPVCVKAVLKSSDRLYTAYTIFLTPESARP